MSGGVVGLLLALSTTVVTRWGRPWFTLSLGIVIGVMMVCYVAVPSRLIGVKPSQSRRDKLVTTVAGGVLGVAVCTPPYLLGRLGLLMLGSGALLILGIVLLARGGAAGGRHGRGQGDQDERQPHSDAQLSQRVSSNAS